MTDEYLIRGRSRIFRPKPGGGEGPWYSDGGCGFIIIDGVEGDQYVVWGVNGGGGGISVAGPAVESSLVGGENGITLITVTSDGEFQINQDACSGGGILAHLLPPGSPITTTCG